MLRSTVMCLVLGISFLAVESARLDSLNRDVHVNYDDLLVMRRTTYEVVKAFKMTREIDLSGDVQYVREQNRTGCGCKGYGCGCCLRLKFEKIKLDENGCVNITYLPKEIGLELLVSLNNRTIIDTKVSAKNPPPICAAIPYVHKLASLCIRFYNLDVKDKHFSGCVDVEAELAGIVVEEIKLGCFRIPPKTGTNGWTNAPPMRERN